MRIAVLYDAIIVNYFKWNRDVENNVALFVAKKTIPSNSVANIINYTEFYYSQNEDC